MTIEIVFCMRCEIGNYTLIRKEHSTWSILRWPPVASKCLLLTIAYTLSSYVKISGLNLDILASRSFVLTTRLPVLLRFGAINCGIWTLLWQFSRNAILQKRSLKKDKNQYTNILHYTNSYGCPASRLQYILLFD